MAKLPQFAELGLEAPRPQAGAASYRATSGMEEAPSAAAAKFGEVVQQIAFQQQDALNTTRAEDAWNQYKSRALDLSVGNGGFATIKGGNAVNGKLFQTYSGQLADVRKQLEAGLEDDDVRRRFSERANVTDLQFKDSLLRHYTTQRDAYEQQTFDGSVATAAAMVSAAPLDQGIFDTALLNTTRRAEALAAHQGITDKGAIDKIKGAARDTLITKRIDSLLYSFPIVADQLFRLMQDQIHNPETRLLLQHKTREAALSVSATIEAGALIDRTRQEVDVKTRRPLPPVGQVETGFEGAVESLIKREGGYKASDGKSKAPVNFGINQRANPDIDVKKLTKDQAKEIYRTRYWNEIGGDTLPPATAMVALDAAALQGPEVAKKLLLEADGDPQTMIDIRRRQLTALAARDPEQAENLPGWLKRLDGLEAQVAGMQRVAYHPDDPTAQDTSGLPNSRDLAAQLPMMDGQVDKRTNELYGSDQTNPDWQAFNRRMKQELRAKVAADVQQLAAIQRQAQGTVIDAILGSRDGGVSQPAAGAMTVGGQMPAKAQITSFSGIQANPDLMRAWQMLDPGVKPALLNLMNRTFDNTAGDSQLYRSLFNRIHLDPGAPGKIDFYKQIVDPAIVDRLNMQQIQSLRAEIDRNETPGGRSINQMRKAADAQASNWFRTTLNSNINFAGQKLTNPTAHIDWTMRWNDEVGRKVDAYVAAGQPDKVRMMFMPGTPESVIEPAYLQTFVGAPRTAAQGLAAAAAGAQPQAAPIAQPTTIDTREKLDAWFKTLPPEVDRFVGTDGKVRMVPARTQPAAGQVSPAVAPPPAAAAQPVTEKAAAPAASQAAPAAPMTAESFEVVEKPDNVAGNLAAIKAARTRASEIRKAGAQGPQYELTGPIVSIIRGIKEGLLDKPAQLGQVLQAMIPTELEAVYAGFEAIKKARRVSRADQDILNEVIRYGLLTPDDEKLARKLLERIGQK